MANYARFAMVETTLQQSVKAGGLGSRCDSPFVGTVREAKTVTKHDKWRTVVHVQGRDIQCELDTGAQANVLPMTSTRGSRHHRWRSHRLYCVHLARTRFTHLVQ